MESQSDSDRAALTEDEILAALSDYHDGSLPAARRAEIESKLRTDATWKRLDAELREPAPALGGLTKVAAPEQFVSQVTDTIHRRSAGRFFARRTLGDRVPIGWLLVVAALLLGGLTTVWCRSTTGSLRGPLGAEPPKPPAPEELVPRP